MEKKVEDFMTKSIMNRLQEYQDKRFKDFIEEQYKSKKSKPLVNNHEK
jgi:hypothetical protein